MRAGARETGRGGGASTARLSWRRRRKLRPPHRSWHYWPITGHVATTALPYATWRLELTHRRTTTNPGDSSLLVAPASRSRPASRLSEAAQLLLWANDPELTTVVSMTRPWRVKESTLTAAGDGSWNSNGTRVRDSNDDGEIRTLPLHTLST